MREIKLSVPCDEKTCGGCQTLKTLKYGNGKELNRPYCKIFGKYMYNEWTQKPILERLPECIAAEV